MKKIFIVSILTVLSISGFCLEISGQKKIKTTGTAGKYQWGGTWSVPSRYTSSTLTVKMLPNGKFNFTIEAANGANMGEVSGIAVIKGNKAFFDDRESAKKDADNYGCKLTFTHKNKLIEIEQNEKCSSYAGLGVVFANDYYKGNPPVKEQNFVEREVFPNLTLDSKFKALVGQDYEKFLDNFHQIYEEEDLDGLNAKVFSACVRGVCPWNAGIIMFDQNGNIWAAVLSEDNEDKTFVHYYTNVSAWADKLPKTIENWTSDKRELNENLKIIYKSKK